MEKTLLMIIFLCLGTFAQAQNSGPISFDTRTDITGISVSSSGNTTTRTTSGSTVGGIDFRIRPDLINQRSGSRSAQNVNTFEASPVFRVGSTGTGFAESSAIALTPPEPEPPIPAQAASTPANGAGAATQQPTSNQPNGAPPKGSGAGTSAKTTPPKSTAPKNSPSTSTTTPRQAGRSDTDLSPLEREALQLQIERNKLEIRSGLSREGVCGTVDCLKPPSTLSPAETAQVAADYYDRVGKGVPLTPEQSAIGKTAAANTIYSGARDFGGTLLNLWGQLRGAGKISDAIGKGGQPGSDITPITPIPNRPPAGTSNQIPNSGAPQLPPPKP